MDTDIDKQKGNFFRGELERLNSYLSDSTTRIGVLITIGGLLSFLPSLLEVAGEGYLEYFLIWTFPFLLVTLICYYPSSFRVQSVIKGVPFASTGSDDASRILKNRTAYLEFVWRKTVEFYDSALFWYRISNAFMYAYLFSLSTSFYTFTFLGEPSLRFSISIALTSVAIIGTMLFWTRLKSAKNLIIDAIQFDVPVGGDIPKGKIPSNDLTAIIDFFKKTRALQHIDRFTPQPNGRFENDAEHSWAVAFICMMLSSRIEKELGIKIDQAKMFKMALLHDLAEIETGDTKQWDKEARVNKEEREREAMKSLTSCLPEDLKEEVLALWEECEKKETLEAKIVKSVDRFDPVLHRMAFKIGWEGSVEDEHATVDALNARQLPRHEFSKILTETFELIRDEAIEKGMFKV